MSSGNFALRVAKDIFFHLEIRDLELCDLELCDLELCDLDKTEISTPTLEHTHLRNLRPPKSRSERIAEKRRQKVFKTFGRRF